MAGCLAKTSVARLFAACLFAAALFAVIASQPSLATEPALATSPAAAAFAAGEVTADVVSLSDPAQRYALYLPSAYDASRTWPVLFVLDPRGRATHALGLFRDAAEAHGWIVLSAYGSRSDTEDDPNSPAFRALLGDAQQRFAIETRRLYLAGMSGTAKVSWPFARMLEGNVAGVIGTGGALPPGMPLGDRVAFAFYGLAGNTDFNYREMRELDQALAAASAVHRFASFEGPHGWGPAESYAQAVAWMELMAMRGGLTEPRAALIDRLLVADREAAEAVRDAGDVLATWQRYDQIVRDFAPLRDVASAVAARDAVDAKALARARADEHKLLRAERDYRARIQRWLDRLAAGGALPVARSLAELDVPALIKSAAAAPSREAASAARRLETVYVQVAFYLPQTFRARDNLDRAVLMLEVASAIKPEAPGPYWQVASLHAERGDLDAAFAALDSAVSRGPVDLERLASDPQWAPLHKDARWRALLERLG